MSILVEHYLDLLSLTQKEQEILKLGNFDELDGVLLEKGAIIDKIDAYNPGKEELAISYILEILEEIKAISETNRQLLSKELENMGKKIELVLRDSDTGADYEKVLQGEAAILDLKA